ncbi:MAG: Gmad2 immunoglobulin-like domain-containing protein [Gaiellaceae bacterium]
MRRALPIVFLLLLAGCGGQKTAETTPLLTQAPTTTAAALPLARQVLVVYGAGNGKLVAGRVLVPQTRAVGRAALAALGLSVGSLVLSNGTATVSLDPEPEGVDLARVVFTLTEFRSVRRVSLGGRTLTRADMEEFAPPILVVSPQPGDTAASPLRVHGTADTFEATFMVDVVDGAGTVLVERTVTATSGSGQRGTFDETIPFTGAKPGGGKLVAFESSAENGERIHVVEIPLVFG